MVVRHFILKIFFLFFMMLVAGAPVYAGPASGPPTVPKTCDGGFYNQMGNRAWMEANRELEVAQTLILKPDSVLEYSCFNEILNKNTSENKFASGEDFNGKLVRPVLEKYLEQNFKHPLAGGAYRAAASSTCNAMYQVWDFLKCRNFNKDDFRTFLEVYATDSRVLPEICNAPERATHWYNAIRTANPLPLDPPKDGGATKVKTYLDIMDPEKCSASIAVPTGLILMDRGSPDAACSAPGCHIDGNSCK